ncbi:hereditary hemochromatosis protein homolog [Megalops cyprinoides]|uniref:hereditary hemochromatosis protein homolog n=1 Tax=Megalops cyprinoides TaxID=118141 RepID=UPI00186469A9|nr:hereditary hemochromatosis protein homolog [Megalops cyprinoides]
MVIMEAQKVCALLSWILGVIVANDYTGNHSLIIFVTFAPGHSSLPEYTSYGMLDDLRVFHYESNSMTFSSPLKHHSSLSSVWRDLETCTTFKSGFFRRFIRDANETLGLKGPILQLIYGCHLDEEGNQQGLYHFSVNGEHSLTLDQESMSWTTYHPHALGFKDILDGFKIWNRNNMMYIKQDCVPRLKKFYEHGEATISRKVRPEVALTAREAGAVVVLVCVVTGFYPKEILVAWERDGSLISENVLSTDLLPNHDLTYQVQKSLDILSDDKHKYLCRVEHSSLDEPLRVHWDPYNVGLSSKHIGILGVLSFVAVVLLTICVVICLKRRRG